MKSQKLSMTLNLMTNLLESNKREGIVKLKLALWKRLVQEKFEGNRAHASYGIWLHPMNARSERTMIKRCDLYEKKRPRCLVNIVVLMKAVRPTL